MTSSPAQIFEKLADFDGANGSRPQFMALVEGDDGDLYGTTSSGGNGAGTVFKVTVGGVVIRLYSFCSQTGCADGLLPYAGLVHARDGNFYGTTSGGGAKNLGTIFKISPSGRLTTLHSFDGKDGANPTAALTQASDGDFYGTTYYGAEKNEGTVFKITPQGTLTTLHVFKRRDGANPLGRLVNATDGNFYGTTSQGGGSNACDLLGSLGCGTVFKISPQGTLTTLHVFKRRDGANPLGGLVNATDGNFYGTTSQGGGSNACGLLGFLGCGTLFKITPKGTLTALHVFERRDGAYPVSWLTQANDGDFYGTTFYGGDSLQCYAPFGCGTTFKISPGGNLTTLHSFDGPDGAFPNEGLMQHRNGNLYGTTWSGGINSYTNGYGTVFRLSIRP